MSREVQLFAGFDEREALGFSVFLSSVLEHSTVPVAIHPLDARGMPVGSNAFTYSRFLVPWMSGFKGHAIFADASDMLMLGDIKELDDLFDESKAVQVVQHPNYMTKHRVKYLGTSMECPNLNYDRKQWMSVFIVNCAHVAWADMTPQAIVAARPLDLLKLHLMPDEDIGALPNEWNRLADENQAVDGAKLLHWTAGLPCFPRYHNAPGADLWRAQLARMQEVA